MSKSHQRWWWRLGLQVHAQCHIPAQICLISCLKEYENLAVYYNEIDFLQLTCVDKSKLGKPSCSNRHLVDTKRIECQKF